MKAFILYLFLFAASFRNFPTYLLQEFLMDLFTKLFGGSLGFEPLAFDTSGHNKVLPYRPSRAHMLQATGKLAFIYTDI